MHADPLPLQKTRFVMINRFIVLFAVMFFACSNNHTNPIVQNEQQPVLNQYLGDWIIVEKIHLVVYTNSDLVFYEAVSYSDSTADKSITIHANDIYSCELSQGKTYCNTIQVAYHDSLISPLTLSSDSFFEWRLYTDTLRWTKTTYFTGGKSFIIWNFLRSLSGNPPPNWPK
jgi:hypothetical protein